MPLLDRVIDNAGPAAVIKTGPGTMIYDAANTYSGPTTITAGVIRVGVANVLSPSSAVIISGGTLDATAGVQTVSSLTVGSLGSLNLSVGTLFSSTGADSLGGTLNLFGAASGTTGLMSYASCTGTFANLNLNGAASSATLDYTPTELYLVVPAVSGPAWSAASGNWSNGSNWTTGSAPNGRGQTAVLNNAVAATSPLNVTLDVPVTLGTLVLGNSDGTATAGFKISAAVAGALTLDNSGSTSQVVVQAGTHVISAPITLAGNVNVAPAAGSMLTLSGNIGQSAASSLTLSNAGTLILSGSNSYTGGTTITAGVLKAGAAGALRPVPRWSSAAAPWTPRRRPRRSVRSRSAAWGR